MKEIIAQAGDTLKAAITTILLLGIVTSQLYLVLKDSVLEYISGLF